jgi:hypothetical protein
MFRFSAPVAGSPWVIHGTLGRASGTGRSVKPVARPVDPAVGDAGQHRHDRRRQVCATGPDTHWCDVSRTVALVRGDRRRRRTGPARGCATRWCQVSELAPGAATEVARTGAVPNGSHDRRVSRGRPLGRRVEPEERRRVLRARATTALVFDRPSARR